MASVFQNKRGQWIVQYPNPSGGSPPRPTIHLGRVDKRFAEEVCRRVELLLEAQALGRAPDLVTIQWLTTVPAKLQKKLAAHGFADGPNAATLAELCRYCVTHADVEAATLEKYEHASANLVAFFGAQRPIHRINQGDALEFRVWLAKSGRRPKEGPLAPSTVVKRLEQCKSFFAMAVKKQWVASNPFDGMQLLAAANTDRQFFVGLELIDKLLEYATPEMALLIRLARFAGLRVPSEVWPLEWGWIDWDAGTLNILCQKTKRFKKWRTCPLFPEIRNALHDALEAAPKGAKLIFPNLQGITATAIRNRLERLCVKAKVLPWEKLWQNMRSTRQTELLEDYPIHVACAWLGNSPRVAIRNYGQVTKDHIRRACGGTCSALQRSAPEGVKAL